MIPDFVGDGAVRIVDEEIPAAVRRLEQAVHFVVELVDLFFGGERDFGEIDVERLDGLDDLDPVPELSLGLQGVLRLSRMGTRPGVTSKHISAAASPPAGLGRRTAGS